MGGCVSCESPSSSAFHNVRVVHLNGYVEDFAHPVSVSQVAGDDPPKHFVCTTLQLLSPSISSKPLKGDTQLLPGQVYFKLPCSLLHTDFSPVDLASLAKRLTAIAKSTTGTNTVTTRSRAEEEEKPRLQAGPLARYDGGGGRRRRRRSSYGYGVGPWKPMLDTIGERSENSFSQKRE